MADAWYSSLNNIKCIRSFGWSWVVGIRKNRKVNRNETLKNLDIPHEGLEVHLRGYGWVRVFRFVRNESRTDYIATSIRDSSRSDIELIMKTRWSIEVYHREIKQTCGIERRMSRSGRAQRNHVCLAVLAWIERFKRRALDGISFYKQQWDSLKYAISYSMNILFKPNFDCQLRIYRLCINDLVKNE